jgi:hypothetical protein
MRYRAIALFALIGLLGLTANETIARKGGGGKPGTTLTGTVYYQGAVGGQNGLCSMDPDGSNATVVLFGEQAEPSYDLHGDERWFLKLEDGLLEARSESDESWTELLDASDEGVDLSSNARWVWGDAYISWLGSSGVYRAPISFGTSGIEFETDSIELVLEAEVYAYDFSPDLEKIIHRGKVGNPFRVTTLATA